jgi:hypothetical protein
MNPARTTYGKRLRSQLVDVLQSAGLDPEGDPIFGEVLETVAVFIEDETLRSFKRGLARKDQPQRAPGGRA